jgi:hypothetical protein
VALIEVEEGEGSKEIQNIQWCICYRTLVFSESKLFC